MKKKELSKRHQVIVHMNIHLLKFLLRRHLLTNFVDETVRQSWCIPVYREIQKYSYFCEFFSWSKSKRGLKYWATIDADFDKYLYNLKYYGKIKQTSVCS